MFFYSDGGCFDFEFLELPNNKVWLIMIFGFITLIVCINLLFYPDKVQNQNKQRLVLLGNYCLKPHYCHIRLNLVCKYWIELKFSYIVIILYCMIRILNVPQIL